MERSFKKQIEARVIRPARAAALADPEGERLEQCLVEIERRAGRGAAAG